MFGQLFGRYLVEEGVLTEDVLKTVLDEQSKIRVRLGVIAVADKLLTQEQAEEINRIQVEEDKRFGDIAVEKGYLTAEQVDGLLSKQGNPYMQFLQVFVEKSKVKVSKIDGYLESFQKHLGFDDSEMEALKRDEFDSLPNVFASKPYVTQIAGLVLRNINRFVTNDFYFDRIRKTDRLDYRSMVAQRCDGDIDVCIGFATEENYDALSVIASKYSGEDCSGRSIETYDGVGEFINCVSGLLSTTLSQNDVNIEIKPQMAYENQTAVGSAYILPMFVDNKPVTLYIAVDSDVNVGNVPVIHKVQTQASKPVEEGKGTVLIVDDSGMSRKMLRNLLEEAGYAVVAEASDGLEGVTAYKQYNPSVVTLDITMPNMDGIEALKQIMDYDEGAKAIMITAAGQQNKIIEALKIGAEKFITKPYDKDEVLKTVDELINKK